MEKAIKCYLFYALSNSIIFRKISLEFPISLRNVSKNNWIRQGIKQAYKVALTEQYIPIFSSLVYGLPALPVTYKNDILFSLFTSFLHSQLKLWNLRICISKRGAGRQTMKTSEENRNAVLFCKTATTSSLCMLTRWLAKNELLYALNQGIILY